MITTIIRNYKDVKIYIDNLLNKNLISKKLRIIILGMFIEYFKYAYDIPYIEINYSEKQKEIDRYRYKITSQDIIISFNYDDFNAKIKILLNNNQKTPTILINRNYSDIKKSSKCIYNNRYIRNTFVYVEKKLLQLLYYSGLR